MHLLKSKEKKERSLGTKLGLKAHRCNSPKCAMIRRPNRPGVHIRPARGGGSEFKQQLMEKQKIKVSYGLSERQMKTVVSKSLENKQAGVTDQIINKLESRLDNAAYRLGFAPSRIMARQLISHGHFMVNGKKVTIPSFSVKPKDVVAVKEASKSMPLFKDLSSTLKGDSPEVWLSRNIEKLEGTIKSKPEGVDLPFDVNLVIDYYSR